MKLVGTSKFRVKPPTFSCDKNISDQVEPPLPNRSFNWLICGPPGAGKSSLLINLLTSKTAYHKAFDHIHLIIPPHSLASMTNKAIKDHDKVYDELDYETLAGIYTKLEEAADDGERSLIVIDDQAAAMKSKEIQDLLKRIIYNRRHLKTSILTAVQSYITVPLAIRKSVDYLTMFHFSNLKEFRALQDELVFLPPDKFDELVRFVFDKPHSELFVDILGNKFYKDFNLIDIS